MLSSTEVPNLLVAMLSRLPFNTYRPPHQPLLQILDLCCEFVVVCDSSGISISTVLHQKRDRFSLDYLPLDLSTSAIQIQSLPYYG
jgi:hypothetical protein